MNSVNHKSISPLQVWREPDDQGQTVLNAIIQASQAVDISIYELGGPRILAALKTAKQNGVDIRIMFNGQFFVGNDPTNSRCAQQYAVANDLNAAPGNGQL